MATKRAIAMIAGMIREMIGLTFSALIQSTAKRRRAASEDSLGGTTMRLRDALAEACVVGTPMPRKDFFEVEAQAQVR